MHVSIFVKFLSILNKVTLVENFLRQINNKLILIWVEYNKSILK